MPPRSLLARSARAFMYFSLLFHVRWRIALIAPCSRVFFSSSAKNGNKTVLSSIMHPKLRRRTHATDCRPDRAGGARGGSTSRPPYSWSQCVPPSFPLKKLTTYFSWTPRATSLPVTKTTPTHGSAQSLAVTTASEEWITMCMAMDRQRSRHARLHLDLKSAAAQT